MQIADIDFCTPLDAEELHGVETACFDHPWPLRSIKYDLGEQGPVVYMKATVKDIIVGYMVLARDEGCAHLMNLAVRPEARGGGIGRQLLLAAEIMAAEWGYRKMILEVRPSNRVARDLYSSIGFEYHSRRKGYYSDGEDALVLTAKLPLRIITPEYVSM